MLKIFIIILAVYLGLAALMYILQRRFIYIPDKRVPDISKAPWP